MGKRNKGTRYSAGMGDKVFPPKGPPKEGTRDVLLSSTDPAALAKQKRLDELADEINMLHSKVESTSAQAYKTALSIGRQALQDKIEQHEHYDQWLANLPPSHRSYLLKAVKLAEDEAKYGPVPSFEKPALLHGEQMVDLRTTPSAIEQMRNLRNLPWNPEADVPLKFDIGDAISDEELERLAKGVVVGDTITRKAPALDLARKLMQGQQDDDAEKVETLADVVYAAAKNPRLVYGINSSKQAVRMLRRFADWVRNAKRFVLDDEFVRRAVELSFEPPSRLLELCLIARAPAEKSWIEWNEEVRLKALFEQDSRATLDDGDRYSIAGFSLEVIENGTHVMGSYGVLDLGFVAQPIGCAFEPSGTQMPNITSPADVMLNKEVRQYLVHKEQYRTGDERPYAGPLLALGDLYVNRYMPSTMEEARTDAEMSALTELINRSCYCLMPTVDWVGIEPISFVKKITSTPQELDRALSGTAGDYRFMLAVLALMSSSYTLIDVIDRREKNVGAAPARHQRQYLVHSHVHLKLPKERPFKVIIDDLGKSVIAHKRRHHVLAHWRERQATKNNGCQHDFEAIDPMRLRCTKCEHRKWRVNQYERGDASLGYVVKDFTVSPSAKRRPSM